MTSISNDQYSNTALSGLKGGKVFHEPKVILKSDVNVPHGKAATETLITDVDDCRKSWASDDPGPELRRGGGELRCYGVTRSYGRGAGRQSRSMSRSDSALLTRERDVTRRYNILTCFQNLV